METIRRFRAGQGYDLMFDFKKIILDAPFKKLTAAGGQERTQDS